MSGKGTYVITMSQHQMANSESSDHEQTWSEDEEEEVPPLEGIF